jgi:hypothetical protein
LGLGVIRTKKGWEIESIPASAIGKFSRRTALIEELAAKKGITDPREKSELGGKTRQRKQKDLTMDELRREWRSRLSNDERSGIAQTGNQLGTSAIPQKIHAADKAAKLAVEHCFECKSVVPERTLLAEALKRSYGESTVEATEGAVREQEIIVGDYRGRRMITTSALLAIEKRILEYARNGRGTTRPLHGGPHTFQREWLNEGQRNAVNHVLNSTDRVIAINGRAGVGKTSMMQEAVEAIESGGKKVFTFAPSTNASRGVLRKEGFANAETVAMLLTDEKLQKQVQGQVCWIDEAGLLDTRAMGQVFDLAEKLDARIILSGDTRQHGSVQAGAPMRLLETDAGIVPAEIKSILRQKGAYKAAVQALSEGDVRSGFDKLEALGWIKEVNGPDRYKALARDYVATVTKGKSALVVSPTNFEAETVVQEIRSELKRTLKPFAKDEEFMMGSDEREFLMLKDNHLTVAQRLDVVNYTPGSDMLVFHQNAKGFGKGDRVRVADGRPPLALADKFSVYRAGMIPIAPGEQLRITKNGKTRNGAHRLNNGAIVTVEGFTAGGDIRLTNGWTVAKDFGFIQPGYVVTSHASQGMTVDRVLIAESAQSFPAATAEQFYVSVSRARERATIYTDDKKLLLEAVKHSDDRLSATGFVAGQKHDERTAAIQRMKRQIDSKREAERDERGREVSHER